VREGILRHARGQPLHLRRRKIGQAVGRRQEGFGHDSLPLQWIAIMQIWVDADACPGVIKKILFRAAARHSLPLILIANQLDRFIARRGKAT